MNVRELIKRLQVVEDQDLPVVALNNGTPVDIEWVLEVRDTCSWIHRTHPRYIALETV